MLLDELLSMLGRFLAYAFFEVAGYHLGRVVLRALTLGRFPRREDSELQRVWISAFGLLVLLSGFGGLAVLVGRAWR